MHIIYIHQYFTTPDQCGGTRSYEMSKRLIAAGHRVSMICGTTDTMNIQGKTGTLIRSNIEGIDVYRIIEPYSNSMGFVWRWYHFMRFAKKALKIAKTIKEVDLVFATSTPLTVGDPGRKAAKYHHCPFIFEVRDLWPEAPIDLGLLKNPILIYYLKCMELRAYRTATHCIGLSPRMVEGIAETGFPSEKITMIPNGSDLDAFVPSQCNTDIEAEQRFGKSGDIRFVYAGAHGLANGLHNVLESINILKQKNIQGVHFNFIGEGGKRDGLIQQSEEYSLQDYISWIPHMTKKELCHYLPQMDVGMLVFKNNPTIYRGTSPNKFFDYIASGIPVLTNYPGWLAGYINERQCGKVVPPDNPEAFADAVIDLMNQRNELKTMGSNARKLAEEVFSRDLLGKRFVETLENAYSEWNNKSK
jgi:glycosyltransferase involved in cell wall biosynthesis